MVRLAPDGAGPRLAVKDCIDVAGLPTTAGCPVVAEMAEPAANDAPVVASAREAGARIVGKTSLTELGWSPNGVNHWAGTPVNPKDPRRLPGGSSSGSAVAVAMGEADVSFGTDTGGSVRIPAACCGVVGLKTTFGRVSMKGVYPLAPSLDTVSPMGPDVAATELGMRLMEPDFSVRTLRDLTAGRLTVTGVEGGVDPVVDAAVDAFRVIVDAEGFRTNAYLMSYLNQLSPHIRRNLERGARLSRADREAADKTRERVRAVFGSLLADYPVLVLPTLTGQPPLRGERGYALTTLTAPANLAGLAALSLPVPAEDGVIASLQVIGPDEETVLAFGRVIEAAVTG